MLNKTRFSDVAWFHLSEEYINSHHTGVGAAANPVIQEEPLSRTRIIDPTSFHMIANTDFYFDIFQEFVISVGLLGADTRLFSTRWGGMSYV
jgi:hypothetical protein